MLKSNRFASLLLCLCGTALAQVDRGNIQGLVIDPSGAVVAGADVRLVNSATNLSQQTVTSSNGTYAFFNMPVGLYDLTVEGKGFRRAEVKGIKVEVNQQSRADVTLQVGDL